MTKNNNNHGFASKFSPNWYWQELGFEIVRSDRIKTVLEPSGKVFCTGLNREWERLLARHTYEMTTGEQGDKYSSLTVKKLKSKHGVPSDGSLSIRALDILIKARDAE